MHSDFRLLVVALLAACLPWSGGALVTLLAGLLLAHGVLLGLVLSGSQPIGWIERAQEACLVCAVACTRFSWSEEAAQSLGDSGLLLLPGALLQFAFVKAMLFHTRAHRQMEFELNQRTEQSLEQMEDTRGGQAEPAHLLLQAVFQLGSQTAGMALLQTACLLFSRPSGAWWLVWCCTISLATFLNSKAQDLMLKPVLPGDSRLC